MLHRYAFLLSLLFAGAASAQQVGSAPAFGHKADPAGYALVAPQAEAPARRFTLAPPHEHEYATLRANNARLKRLQIGFGRELPAELASLSFDPRLLWDAHDHAPLKAPGGEAPAAAQANH